VWALITWISHVIFSKLFKHMSTSARKVNCRSSSVPRLWLVSVVSCRTIVCFYRSFSGLVCIHTLSQECFV
jgi:hypothetical protein